MYGDGDGDGDDMCAILWDGLSELFKLHAIRITHFHNNNMISTPNATLSLILELFSLRNMKTVVIKFEGVANIEICNWPNEWCALVYDFDVHRIIAMVTHVTIPKQRQRNRMRMSKKSLKSSASALSVLHANSFLVHSHNIIQTRISYVYLHPIFRCEYCDDAHFKTDSVSS